MSWTLQQCAGCGRVAVGRSPSELCPQTDQMEAQVPVEVVPARQRPTSGNHALLIGQVAGLLSREFGAEIIDDADGIHLDTVRVTRPSGTYLVTVRPE